MGIVTLITEVLTKIRPKETLRLVTGSVCKKRNCSDSSGNSPAKILASRCACKKSRRVKSSYTRPEVFTETGRKTMGSVLCVYLTIIPYLISSFRIQNTVRLRSTCGGHSVCERSVCMLSGTSISVMSHCDIHHECARLSEEGAYRLLRVAK